MTTVVEILRDCAYGLPIEEDSEHGLFGDKARRSSPFICDHLDNMLFYEDVDTTEAKEFLIELGMPTGIKSFLMEHEACHPITTKYGERHQLARAAWLFFAADLAEEWGV